MLNSGFVQAPQEIQSLKRQQDAMQDSMMDEPETKKSCVLCCQCGATMQANPTSMCINCVKATVDITDHLARSIVLPHCRECDRYLGDSRWMKCERESKDLLALCLKKIKGLKKVKLVDAQFIWTEEHSKRLKVKLTLQKEIHVGAALQQELVIEFVINNHQCESCKRSYTPHTWKAAVQIRQKVDHRRTIMHLEQLILKHEAHEKLLFLCQSPEGLDFHFGSQSHALRFADFVRQWAPAKVATSRTLVSHDTKNNSYNYKYTVLVDLCPVCREDVVYLPKKVAAANGGVSQVMLVQKVSTSISLIDPNTLLGCDIANTKYWENPFESILTRKHLTEFVVLDKEDVDNQIHESSIKKCGVRKRFKLCDVEIARLSDLGNNDERVRVRCHLGHLLEAGDHVLGYDMRTVNISGEDNEKVSIIARSDQVQDVILVKKKYLVSNSRREQRRLWDLKRLNVREDEKNNQKAKKLAEERDFETFKCDLEEDEDLRKDVNLYKVRDRGTFRRRKHHNRKPGQADGEDGEEDAEEGTDTILDTEEDSDCPEVPIDELAELMGGLTVSEDQFSKKNGVETTVSDEEDDDEDAIEGQDDEDL